MQGRAGPPPDLLTSAHRQSWILAVIATVSVLTVGLVLASDLPRNLRHVVSTAALVGAGFALALACRYRYRRNAGLRRRTWLLLCAAALCGALGNLWVSVVGFSKPVIPIPLGELSLIAALLLGTAGLITYPSTPRRGTDLGRMVLDGVVLGGSVLLIASHTLFPRILEQEGDTPLARFTPLLAPVIDLLLATVCWLLFTRSGRTDRPALAMAGIGFALFAVSDGLAAVARSQGGGFEFGTVVDLGWIAGYLLLTVGVSWSTAPRLDGTEPSPERSAVTGTMVMFGMLVVAVFLHLTAAAAGNASASSNALLILVLLAVSARQTLLTFDNEELRRGLERRVIERSTELRAVTQRTDLLVDSVGEGVYGVNQAGEVTFVNPAAVAALGFAQGEILGRDAHALFHDHFADGGFDAGPLLNGHGPGGPSRSACYLTAVISEGLAVSSIEDVYRDATGRLIPVEVTASPLNPDAGAPGAVVVFRDVTQRREVDRMKNEFVSMVSHELRTPLTAIRGSLGLLAGGALGQLSAPATRMVEIAMDSSRRLTRLIDQILDLERIESGTVPLEIGSFEAGDLIDSAVNQIRVIAEASRVSISVTGRDGTVLTDADRVVQTLLNLLGNAVKFSPPGSTVNVSSTEHLDTVEFRIDDRGRGIPPEMLELIFTRFEQVDSSDAREKGGTGLGLAISRSLVERLGGRIWAENRATGGATFRFVLPRSHREYEEPDLPLLVEPVPAEVAGPNDRRHDPDPALEAGPGR